MREDTDWLTVGLLLGAGASAAMHLGKAAIALPVLRAESSLSAPGSALLLAAPGLVGSVTAVGLGLLLARPGAMRWVLGGLALSAASSLGAGASAPAALLGWRFAEALGGVAVILAAPVLIGRLVLGPDRSLAFGLWSGYMPLGQGLVLLAGPGVIALAGWPGLWFATSAASALVLLALLAAPGRSGRLRAPAPRRARQRAPQQGRELVRLLLLASVFLTYTLQWMALVGYLPTVSTDAGLSLGVAGVLTAVVVLLNVPGNLVGGLLWRRGISGPLVLVIATSTMTVAGATVFVTAAPLGLRLLAALVFSAVGGLVPSTLLRMADASPVADLGLRNAVLAQGSQIGAAIGPLLVGLTIAATGSLSVAALVAGAAGASCLLLVLSLTWLGAPSTVVVSPATTTDPLTKQIGA